MNLDLADIGAVLVVFSPLVLLALRIFVIPGGASIEDLFVPRRDIEWPRGVQEEEPIRWHVERLTARDERVPSRTPTNVSARAPGPSHGAAGPARVH